MWAMSIKCQYCNSDKLYTYTSCVADSIILSITGLLRALNIKINYTKVRKLKYICNHAFNLSENDFLWSFLEMIKENCLANA